MGMTFTIPSDDYPTLQSAVDAIGKNKNCVFNISGTLEGVDQTKDSKRTDENNYTRGYSAAHALNGETGVKLTSDVNGFLAVEMAGDADFAKIVGGAMKETKKDNLKQGKHSIEHTQTYTPNGSFTAGNSLESSGTWTMYGYEIRHFKTVNLQSNNDTTIEIIDGSSISISDKSAESANAITSEYSTKYSTKSSTATLSGRGIKIGEVSGFSKLNINGETDYPVYILASGKIAIDEDHVFTGIDFTPTYQYAEIGKIDCRDFSISDKISSTGTTSKITSDTKIDAKATIALDAVQISGMVSGAKSLTVSNSIIKGADAIASSVKTETAKQDSTLTKFTEKSTDKATGKFVSLNTLVDGSLTGFSTVTLKAASTVTNNVAAVLSPEESPMSGEIIDYLASVIIPNGKTTSQLEKDGDYTITTKSTATPTGSLTMENCSEIHGNASGFKKVTLEQGTQIGGTLFAYKMDIKNTAVLGIGKLDETATFTASGTLNAVKKDTAVYAYPIYDTAKGTWYEQTNDIDSFIGGDVFGFSTVVLDGATIGGTVYGGKLTKKTSGDNNDTVGNYTFASSGKFTATDSNVNGGLCYYSTVNLTGCTVNAIVLGKATKSLDETDISITANGTLNAKDSIIGNVSGAKTIKLTNCTTLDNQDVVFDGANAANEVKKCTAALTANGCDLSRTAIYGFKTVTITNCKIDEISSSQDAAGGTLTLTDATAFYGIRKSISGFKKITLKGSNMLSAVSCSENNDTITVSGDAFIDILDGNVGSDTLKLSAADLVIGELDNIEKISGSGTLYLFNELDPECIVDKTVNIVMLDSASMDIVHQEDLGQYQIMAGWEYPAEMDYTTFTAGNTQYLVAGSQVIGKLA